MTTNHTISDILEQQGLFPESPLVFYQGGFELSTVDKLLAEIEVLSLNEKFVNRLKKKVFRVGVEVLQNLFHYFDNNELTEEYREGLFSVYEEDGAVTMISGNFIKNSQTRSVASRIDMINDLSLDKQKMLYRGVLDISSTSDGGGGGLGFIDIARKSENQLDYKFIKIDTAYSFFVLKIKING